MKKILLVLFLVLYTIGFSQEGNVGINTSKPDQSAILELYSTDKGFLLPRVSLQSETDGVTISNPAKGLVVYNLNTSVMSGEGVYFNFGTPSSPLWSAFSKDNSDSGSTIAKMKYLGGADSSKTITVGNLSFRFINGSDDGSSNQPYSIQMKVNSLPNGSTTATYRANRIDFYSTNRNAQEYNISFSSSDVSSGAWKTVSSHSAYAGTHSNILHIGADQDNSFFRVFTQERYGVFWSMVAEKF